MRRLLSIALIALGAALLLGIAGSAEVTPTLNQGQDRLSNPPVANETAAAGKAVELAPPAPETDFLASLEAKEQKTPQQKPVPAYRIALGMIAKLAIVIVLVYLTILGLKKFTNLKSPVAKSGQHIRVLENSMLAANRSLHVVEVGSRKIVIGSTPSQVSMITELPEEEQDQTPVADSGFKNQLAAFISGRKPAEAQLETAATVAELLRESNEYLQDKVREVGTIRGKAR